LEASFPRIRDEFLNIVLCGRVKLHPQSPGGARVQIADGNWKIFELFSCGQMNGGNAVDAPFTSRIIRSLAKSEIPPSGLAYFSILDPHVNVAPHCGPTNTRIRMQLGLRVPEGASMRVGTETKGWKEGKCLVFDDSWEHEVCNASDSMRAVLLVDGWHPDLTPQQRDQLVRTHRHPKQNRKRQREGWQRRFDIGPSLLPSAIERSHLESTAALTVLPDERLASIRATAAKVLHTGTPFISLAATAVTTPSGNTSWQSIQAQASALSVEKSFDTDVWRELQRLLISPAGRSLAEKELVNVIHICSLFWRYHPRNVHSMDAFLKRWPVAEKEAFRRSLTDLGNIREMINHLAYHGMDPKRFPFGATAPLVVVAANERNYMQGERFRRESIAGGSDDGRLREDRFERPVLALPRLTNGDRKKVDPERRRVVAMDVAWMLGRGSSAGDWELRMSMRSFWTHYNAAAKPWIIGHVPSWIDPRKVRCLPWPDPYRRCKDANLLHKAIRLAMEPQISDPFILCSDDHILLRPSTPADFKLWHRGEIPEDPVEGLSRWRRRLANTGRRLRSAGYQAMNFDGHIPYPLRKKWVSEALRFDFARKPGMCVFSTILNCSNEPGAPLDSQPVRGWLGQADMAKRVVDAKLAKNRFACLNAKSLQNAYVVSRLEQLFPDPAPWELDGAKWPRRSRKVNVRPPEVRMFGTWLFPPSSMEIEHRSLL
jgi:hypothetical protein